MSIRLKGNLLLRPLLLGAALFLAACTTTGAASPRANGLVCESHTSTSIGGLGGTKGADCRFKCPDGRLLSLPDAMASRTKDQLNFLFCGVPLPSAPGAASVNAGQALVATPTFAPPLSRYVDSCDLNKHVINIALAQPASALAGKTITVSIQNQPIPCSLVPWLPGVYSCKIPPHTSFPAGIVVRVNGQVVDLWPYTGAGCLYGQGTRVPSPPSLSTAPAPPPAPNPPPVKPPKPPKSPKPPKPPHPHH